MKKVFLLFLGFCTMISWSQQAFHNFGNVQIHDEGSVGFHVDLINDGTFNQNLGLAGFYNTVNSLSISGTQIPRFFDMEVDVVDDLFLDINTEVINSQAYIEGKVITPRNALSISLDYLNNGFYLLENNQRHTDGYTSYIGSAEFRFPVGDDNKLRPLITPAQPNNTIFKTAYFNEDPNFPSTLGTSFNTNNLEGIINSVSIVEYWDFDGNTPTLITLTWDTDSDISSLVDDLQNLRVVGWHINDQEWKDLGNSNVTGNLNSGEISSFIFDPEEYEIVTFGSLIGPDGIIIYNGISPNGDGANDTFVVEGIELFQNVVEIYNRWGTRVFRAVNYQNNWAGVATEGIIINEGEKLPVGTYFYVVRLPEENKEFAGWVYINY